MSMTISDSEASQLVSSTPETSMKVRTASSPSPLLPSHSSGRGARGARVVLDNSPDMILRAHMRYDPATDTVEFQQPIVKADTQLAMLFVEKDLSGIAMAVFDQWDSKKDHLNHRYLYCSNARISPNDILACVKRVSGKTTTYKRLDSTGWKDRDVMFQLYNECGMYGDKKIPDQNVLALGVDLHGVEDFVRSRLLPHLGLTAKEK